MTAFFDTNILIYATIQADHRQAIARRLMSGGGSISVQVLNEFANAAHRKLRKSWDEIHAALQALRSAFAAPLPISARTHELALALAEQHKFSFYDALIIASALEANCTTLYTEDMHHGMTIRRNLQIINPFVGIAGSGS
jgi:predicted nucleic acid-binding protein